MSLLNDDSVTTEQITYCDASKKEELTSSSSLLTYTGIVKNNFMPSLTHFLLHTPSLVVTRGQSNLTKSASQGAHSPVRGYPRGSKVVPLNSWGILVFHSNYRPRMHRLATVHARDNQPTNDQRRHDTAYLNKRLFY